MKILCNNASLCGAVTNVSKAVSERAALKSLEGIKFKLENSMLELTGYDLEIGIKTVIPVRATIRENLYLMQNCFQKC